MQIYHWIESNPDLAYFIYGFTFLAMGLAILIQPRKNTAFKLAGILGILAGFGLTHAVSEWLTMWALIKGSGTFLYLMQVFMRFISFVLLFEFGRCFIMMSETEPSARQRGLAGIFTRHITLFLVSVVFFTSFNSSDPLRTMDVASRYLLALPGGFLTGAGFFYYYRHTKDLLARSKAKKYFFGAGVSFLVYGLLSGLMAAEDGLFINGVFLSTLKVPVILLRIICMAVAAWSVFGALRIFNWEMTKKFKKEIIERRLAEEALKSAYEELKNVQGKLIQAEKMSAIGRLAGGVAHEVNNPLTGVLNMVQLAKMAAEEKHDFNLSEFKEYLDIIEDSALRCKRITGSLLDFSRVGSGKKLAISLNELVEKTAILIGYELKLRNISFESELADPLPRMMGDLQLLQQIVVGLCDNAQWAVGKKFTNVPGGKIFIKTWYNAQEKQVCLSCADNGIGIPGDKIGKIFEPFFTTKDVGEGTGLGLAVAYSFIREHKGTVTVESRENEGTVFSIKFPVCPEEINAQGNMFITGGKDGKTLS